MESVGNLLESDEWVGICWNQRASEIEKSSFVKPVEIADADFGE